MNMKSYNEIEAAAERTLKSAGWSGDEVQKRASIVARGTSSGASAARGLEPGDNVVCKVLHGNESVAVGKVNAEGVLGFDGCVLVGARIEVLSKPYRVAGTDFELTATLADGTTFKRRADDDGIARWRDEKGVEIDLPAEAVSRTPVSE